MEVLREAGVHLWAEKADRSFINTAQVLQVFTEMFVCRTHHLSVNYCKHLPENGQQHISREFRSNICLVNMYHRMVTSYVKNAEEAFSLGIAKRRKLIWKRQKRNICMLLYCLHLQVFDSRAYASTVVHQTNYRFTYSQCLSVVVCTIKATPISNAFPCCFPWTLWLITMVFCKGEGGGGDPAPIKPLCWKLN